MRLIIGNRNYSSWSLRAWLMLRAAGVEFDVTRIPLDVPGYEREILAHSPSGCVPVLLDGDLRVWDTLAIGEYLAERFPAARLWPADPTQRAAARSLSAEMHAGFADLRAELPMNCRATGRNVAPGDAARRDIDRILAIWENCLRTCPGGGPWLMGRFGIVDAMYVPVALRFRTYDIPVPGRASGFMAAVMASEAVRDWMRDAEAEEEIIEREEKGRGPDA